MYIPYVYTEQYTLFKYFYTLKDILKSQTMTYVIPISCQMSLKKLILFFSLFLNKQIKLTGGKMKINKLTSIIAIPILAGAALLSGCSAETGFRVKLLDISAGGQTAIYRKSDNRTETDKEIFKEDSQPYDDSTISNGAIKNSPLWQHYQNRDN